MKLYTIFILIILFCEGAFSQMKEFNYISDFDGRNGPLIPLNIVYNGSKCIAIINNRDLYLFFKTYKRLSKNEYTKEVFALLNNNKILKVKNLDLHKWDFIIADDDKEVSSFAKKGEKVFLEKYFDGHCIKGNIDSKLSVAIIYHAFKLGFGCSVDCESGCILYTKIETWNKD